MYHLHGNQLDSSLPSGWHAENIATMLDWPSCRFMDGPILALVGSHQLGSISEITPNSRGFGGTTSRKSHLVKYHRCMTKLVGIARLDIRGKREPD